MNSARSNQLKLLVAPCLAALLLLLELFATGSAPLAPADTRAAQTPNIVVIMADDLDLALTQTLYDAGHLPNIKTYLWDDGTVFQNAFVTTAICCPSRSTFLTGLYAHNHNVLGNLLPTGGVTRLDDSSTVATWLHDNGYYVGHVGKYLHGYGEDKTAPPGSPLHPAYIPPGYDYWQGLLTPYEFYGFSINANGAKVVYGTGSQDYQTDVLAGLAVQFVQQAETADSQPFFLVVTPVAPHVETGAGAARIPGCTRAQWSVTLPPAPRHAGTLASLVLPQGPAFNEQDVSDKPTRFASFFASMTPADIACAEQHYRDRAEATLAIDDLVGSVVNALIANDEWNDTVVIFTSDNGYFLGEHRLYQKLMAYEEGIRVPLIIRAPGYPAGQSVDHIALNTDWAPTIADLAGVTPGLLVDGRSLVPLLQNPAYTPWRKSFLVEFQGEVQIPFPHFTAIRTAATHSVAPNHLYILWSDQQIEYYDLNTDPFQLQSVHADPQSSQEIKQLRRDLRKLIICGSGTCQTQEDK